MKDTMRTLKQILQEWGMDKNKPKRDVVLPLADLALGDKTPPPSVFDKPKWIDEEK